MRKADLSRPITPRAVCFSKFGRSKILLDGSDHAAHVCSALQDPRDLLETSRSQNSFICANLEYLELLNIMSRKKERKSSLIA